MLQSAHRRGGEPGPGFGRPGLPPLPPPVAQVRPADLPRARTWDPRRLAPGHVTSRGLWAPRQLEVEASPLPAAAAPHSASRYSPRAGPPGTREKRTRIWKGGPRQRRPYKPTTTSVQPRPDVTPRRARCLCPLASFPGASRGGATAGSARRALAPPRGLLP